MPVRINSKSCFLDHAGRESGTQTEEQETRIMMEGLVRNEAHRRVINIKFIKDDSLLNCRLEAENRSMKLRMSE